MAITTTTGLVSSIDYQALINQLVSIQQQPIDALKAQQSALNDRNSAYTTLNGLVQDFQTAADTLRQASNWNIFTTSSSNTAILTASASSTASAGTHQIVVNSLAQASSQVSAGFASATTAIGAGTLSFKVGTGAVQSLTISSTDTLTTVMNNINALNAGVTASIVNNGTTNQLILTSNSTGTANAITINPNGTDSNTLKFSTLQAAANASFTVDGLAVTRSSNTVTDVLPGVTLNLNSANSASTVTLNVSTDTSTLQSRITTLIQKYNAVLNHVTSNDKYDTQTKKAGYFFGDSSARSIMSSLRRALESTIRGLPSTMNNMVRIGMSSDPDTGVVSIDTTALSNALSTNLTGVKSLFVDSTLTGGTTVGIGGLIYNSANNITDFASGTIEGVQKGIQTNLQSIQNDINTDQAALAAYQDSLQTQFASLETLLAGIKSQSSFLSSLTNLSK